MPARAVDPARRDHMHQALFYNSDKEFMAVRPSGLLDAHPQLLAGETTME